MPRNHQLAPCFYLNHADIVGSHPKQGSPSDTGAGTNESASGFTNWPSIGAFYFRWEKLAGVGNAELIPITHTWSLKRRLLCKIRKVRGIECFKAWWIIHTYERERLLLEPSSPLLATSVRWLNYLNLITSLLTQRICAPMPCLKMSHALYPLHNIITRELALFLISVNLCQWAFIKGSYLFIQPANIPYILRFSIYYLIVMLYWLCQI